MGTATMATALGAAMLLYFVLSRRLANHEEVAGSSGGGGGGKRRRGRAARQPSQPPATWMEAVGTLAETLRFTYSETLGKWPIGDLAFGIKYLMRRQILKPAHTILRDECTKSFLVLIRGTHSMKDTLTAVTGAVVPFHHSVLDEGGISKLVLGYAHCGMVAAARWIARGITPCLLQAITQCPEYQIKVTASSWLNDLRDQIQQTRFLNAVYRSATALGTRLQSFSGARARVAGAGALLRPVSSKTLVVMKQAQNVAQAVARSRSALSSWACMGARRRPVGVIAVSQDEMTAETHVKTTVDSESFVVEQHVTEVVEELQYAATSISVHEETEEEALMSEHETSREHGEEEITDGELWFEFDKDRDRQAEVEARTREEEAAAAKEIMEEESAVLKNVEDRQSFSSDSLERQQFYPPGRIMHMVAMPPPDAGPDDPIVTDECTVGLYGTPRHLYSKIRLSNTMINDHYMPMYKKMMEILIEKFANNDDNSGADSTVE
ncbi:unnamed protein product [Triticum turgidum subsp. durum]|uniref:Mono-/di-acylglycerol lipase N-terminal domain-containing protein n=1 Tax=Triticum turgidum subsp. durum TaxID=4567 RepID=A0A9R1S0K4_TRITD|nr:unnamed protein product [Triticum turgidum subsp. durum]